MGGISQDSSVPGFDLSQPKNYEETLRIGPIAFKGWLIYWIKTNICARARVTLGLDHEICRSIQTFSMQSPVAYFILTSNIPPFSRGFENGVIKMIFIAQIFIVAFNTLLLLKFDPSLRNQVTKIGHRFHYFHCFHPLNQHHLNHPQQHDPSFHHNSFDGLTKSTRFISGTSSSSKLLESHGFLFKSILNRSFWFTPYQRTWHTSI